MAENARPPVAVRIVRPYDTEEAFLEAELETVGKTSVILIGAHSRPTGVILRFEVTLQSGAIVLRGEGRVLAHKEAAFRGQPGLALRFTRLDPKSKGLVDRAAQIREARLNGGDSIRPGVAAPPPVPTPAPPGLLPASGGPDSIAPRPVRTSSVPPSVAPRSVRPSAPPRSVPPAADPALTGALTSPTPIPPRPVSKLPSMPPPLDAPQSLPPAADDSGPQVEVMELSSDAIPLSVSDFVPEPSPEPEPEPAREPEPEPEPPPQAPIPSPPKSDRDLLLARLRNRAAGLTDEQRAAVLKRT